MKIIKKLINEMVFISVGISIQTIFVFSFSYVQKNYPHDFWYYLLAFIYVITIIFSLFKMKKHEDFFKIFK
jgi:hypothetical protein